jgi:hypothetical protein
VPSKTKHFSEAAIAKTDRRNQRRPRWAHVRYVVSDQQHPHRHFGINRVHGGMEMPLAATAFEPRHAEPAGALAILHLAKHRLDRSAPAAITLTSPRAGAAAPRLSATVDAPRRLSCVPQPSDLIVDDDPFGDVIYRRAQGNLRGHVAPSTERTVGRRYGISSATRGSRPVIRMLPARPCD